MRVLRNIAIIALLALIVAVVPGGDDAAAALLALISMLFLVLIVAGGYQLFRQYRFQYLGLSENQRGLFVGSLGAIVLMIAGAQKLTSTGGGLILWFGVIAFAVISIIKVWGDSRSSY